MSPPSLEAAKNINPAAVKEKLQGAMHKLPEALQNHKAHIIGMMAGAMTSVSLETPATLMLGGNALAGAAAASAMGAIVNAEVKHAIKTQTEKNKGEVIEEVEWKECLEEHIKMDAGAALQGAAVGAGGVALGMAVDKIGDSLNKAEAVIEQRVGNFLLRLTVHRIAADVPATTTV